METGRSGIALVGSRTRAGIRQHKVEDLYVAHMGDAVRLAFVLTGDLDTAEDLAQDAFLRVASRLGSPREPYNFEAYLKKTIVNLSRSLERKGRRERLFLRRQEAMSAVAEEPPDIDGGDLWPLLMQLPPRQRTAIFLHYHSDLSDQQIADMLGCSGGAAKALRIRALKKLRSEWGEEHE
jgi:RNA polymerase sigma factor (sigma-70 family)